MISNQDYIARSLTQEASQSDLAPQNFPRINTIMRAPGFVDEMLRDSILELKILRLRKVMVKHQMAILSKEQAEEIWGKND